MHLEVLSEYWTDVKEAQNHPVVDLDDGEMHGGLVVIKQTAEEARIIGLERFGRIPVTNQFEVYHTIMKRIKDTGTKVGYGYCQFKLAMHIRDTYGWSLSGIKASSRAGDLYRVEKQL